MSNPPIDHLFVKASVRDEDIPKLDKVLRAFVKKHSAKKDAKCLTRMEVRASEVAQLRTSLDDGDGPVTSVMRCLGLGWDASSGDVHHLCAELDGQDIDPDELELVMSLWAPFLSEGSQYEIHFLGDFYRYIVQSGALYRTAGEIVFKGLPERVDAWKGDCG